VLPVVLLPIMSDEAIIVEGTGSIFLAGSYLVKAAIGETIDNEGGRLHIAKSLVLLITKPKTTKTRLTK
jgi:acetyl-CoA carboxylase carboxyltransferase component